MAIAFWLSCLLVAYVYVGYPALMAIWASARSRRVSPSWPEAEPLSVSIVMAARNEGPRLAQRLENLLALEYPGAFEIIVASDGSTDDTVAVLNGFGGTVSIVNLPQGGKAVALNAAVERASHDIVVFADARQRFALDALVEITRPFADPQIGAATGELVLDCEALDRRVSDRRTAAAAASPERRAVRERRAAESTIADAVGLYWRYEKAIRRSESTVWSTLGATGAIYAMRRSLWRPLPPETILDDVLAPMRVVLAGFRVVFTEGARAYDRTAVDAHVESRRKIRTLAGNYQVLCLEPSLLLPWQNDVWLQYVSHKLGRLIVPYALLVMIASSMALAGRSAFYTAVLVVQCAFYLLAGYGGWLDLRATLAARAAARRTIDSWQPSAPEPRRGAVNA
jgi:cellulose synthase/poly-beta-1,6-N-acetylglucosamine synthase-like glycosyltransferase